jgi:hypothetical protein
MGNLIDVVMFCSQVRRLLAKSPMFQSLSKNRGFVRKLGLTPELLPCRQLEYGNGKSGSLPSLPGGTDDENDEDDSIASALARAAPGAMATHNLPGVRYAYFNYLRTFVSYWQLD